MIGSLTAILLHTPPKLGPGHDDDVIGFAVLHEISVEGEETLGQCLHQDIMHHFLVGMGIEAAQCDVTHAQAEVLHDRFR